MSCAEAGLVLVAFDRATLPYHAGQVLRAGGSHGGLILFRHVKFEKRSRSYARPNAVIFVSALLPDACCQSKVAL